MARSAGPCPSPVLPRCRRPFQTTRGPSITVPSGAEIRPEPPAHSAATPHRCQLGWRPFGGSISMPLRRRCSVVQATPRGRSSTVLAPAGKQYDVCLFPRSPHARKTGNVLTAAWPIAINVMVACRPTSGTTSSLPEGIHRHLGPRPRSNAPSQSLPRTEQAPHAVPSPVDLANATCSVQTDPTAVCVPS